MSEGAMAAGRNGWELWVLGAQHVTEPGLQQCCSLLVVRNSSYEVIF